MALIELQKIDKTYNTDGLLTPVLKQVSFKIDKGEFVAIMGPSGSGKSTLLHILGFLDHPTAGQYIFDGKLVTEYDELEIARLRNERVGFVFQAFNLLPRTSVLDNVRLPLLYSRVKSREWTAFAEKAIKEVGLEHRLHYHPNQLSGGEKQRAAIARALINNPDVIFADEPTGNLDTANSAQVMKIFTDLNKEGHTIILITHEPDIARYAKRVIFVRDGKIESDKQN